MNNRKHIKKTFVKQLESSDCGVACLLSIIQFHRGSSTLEYLRTISGTSTTGTTLLGLIQASEKLGLNAEAFEVDDLNEFKKEAQFPAVLHVVVNERMLHYVVCYKFIPETKKYIIGDPRLGVFEMEETELLKIWKSRALLQIIPNEKFSLIKNGVNNRRKWFLDILARDKNILIVSLVLGVASTILGLATAVFSQKLIDKIIPGKDNFQLVTGLLLLLLVLMSRMTMNLIRSNFLVNQGTDFSQRLTGNFYNSILRLPINFLQSRKLGDLTTRMNDIRRIQNAIASFAGNFTIDILLVIVSTGFIFYYSPLIGCIYAGFVLLFVMLSLKFYSPVTRKHKEVMSRFAAVESNFINTFLGTEIIKVYGKEENFRERLSKTFEEFQLQVVLFGRLGIKYTSIVEFVNILLTVTLLLVSSIFVMNNQLLLGEMVAVVGLSNSIIPAMSRMALNFIQIQEANVAMTRLFEFSGAVPETYDCESVKLDGFKRISFENVSFGFPGREPIIKELSFEVEKGQILGIVGEIGTGKTTVLKLVQRFYEPTSGDLRINDIPHTEIGIREWRSFIGIVPQDVHIFNESILYNIVLQDADENLLRKFDEFLRSYGLDKLFSQFPSGYHTIVGETAVQLSGGQKQLIGIARALFKKPSILLLDEVTASMDVEMEKIMIDIITSIKMEMAVIFITHKEELLSISDNIVELARTEVVVSY